MTIFQIDFKLNSTTFYIILDSNIHIFKKLEDKQQVYRYLIQNIQYKTKLWGCQDTSVATLVDHISSN